MSCFVSRFGLALVAVVAIGCGDDRQPAIVIHAADSPGAGVAIALTDLQSDLHRITGKAITTGDPTADCSYGDLRVLVRENDTLGPQEYSIKEQRCGTGKLVTLEGGSQLAQQWAIYELMETLGVRYFHPEQTLYPTELHWPAAPIDITTSPAFARRALHAHRTHPIELSAPLDADPAETEKLQKHWVDWNVKIRSTDADGWDESVIGTYAYDRGFPRDTGINLVSSQQGSHPVLDPDDPRSEHEQMQAAIDDAMADRDGVPSPNSFGFTINPSEFTTVDADLTIDRMTFITNYIHQRWPDVEVRTINHGTGQGPDPKYHVRFFDLSEFAPPELAVQAHTLMFYDLDRAAPVYGNQNFNFLRDWMIQEQAKRRIHYYPETSWWLTFDLPVPLFLAPVSLEARDHDLATLAPYAQPDWNAKTGIVGHLAFSSGQEWGYWMIDYCTQRMAWDLSLGWKGCLAHVFEPFADGQAIADLLAEVGEAQVAPLRDPGIISMLVGSDDETEAAGGAGIVFHPLPPPPSEVLGWTDDQVATFKQASVDPLPAMSEQYAAWADKAAQLAAEQTDDLAPWVAEMADGLKVTGLRVEHSQKVYDLTLQLRTAIKANNFTAVQALEAHAAADVRAITAKARDVIETRELNYRYSPLLTIVGDEPGSPNAIANQTIYTYRYLGRTHRLFYWTRPDDQVEAMFGVDTVSLDDRMLKIGTALNIDLLASMVHDIMIDFGDGMTATALAAHTYAAQGVYNLSISAQHSAGVINYLDKIAIVARRLDFAKGSLMITEPSGASVLNGLLPGLAIGLGTDTADFMAVGALASGTQVTAHSITKTARTANASATFDLSVELKNVGVATVYGAVVTVADGTGPTDRKLTVTGELSTDEIIQLIVNTGGFDADGARDVVAQQLGYTPDTLPARVTVKIESTGSEP
ncbi:MAG TPA: hypothetical protein VGM39_11720 [Kofleriaceae bacterium]